MDLIQGYMGPLGLCVRCYLGLHVVFLESLIIVIWSGESFSQNVLFPQKQNNRRYKELTWILYAHDIHPQDEY